MQSVLESNARFRFLSLRVPGALAIAFLASCSPATNRQSMSSGNRAFPSASSAAEREQTADQQVQHVLSRLTFGARPGDVQAVRAVGVDAWIARQLEPARVPDVAMDQFLHHFPSLDKSGEELLRQYPAPGQVLAQLAARNNISRDSAKSLSKRKGKANSGDDVMNATLTPAAAAPPPRSGSPAPAAGTPASVSPSGALDTC